MRSFIHTILFLTIFPCLHASALADQPDPLSIVIIKNTENLVAEDIEEIYLTYSKRSDIWVATMKFNDSGVKKFKAALNSNIDRHISLILGNDVVAIPVPIKTEKVFNPLVLEIRNEQTALKLLKVLSN